MTQTRVCTNGHHYDVSLSACPYCPNPKKQDLATTQVLPTEDLERTQLMGEAKAAKPGRKLVGWLVSYTLDPLGVDFKLYEGRNIIGSNPASDIALKDPKVSSHHLTILHRADAFKLKDELSTNGTYVNGEMIDEGALQDGDELTLGDIKLKFRAC